MELFILAIAISLILALAPIRSKPPAETLERPAITRTFDGPRYRDSLDTRDDYWPDALESHSSLDSLLTGHQSSSDYLFDDQDNYLSDYPQDLYSDPTPSELIISSPFERVEYFQHEGKQFMAIITSDTVLIREDS